MRLRKSPSTSVDKRAAFSQNFPNTMPLALHLAKKDIVVVCVKTNVYFKKMGKKKTGLTHPPKKQSTQTQACLQIVVFKCFQ